MVVAALHHQFGRVRHYHGVASWKRKYFIPWDLHKGPESVLDNLPEQCLMGGVLFCLHCNRLSVSQEQGRM